MKSINVYTLDSWVILEIKQEEQDHLYKLLTGVSGGYLDIGSWRISSGIESVEEHEDHYLFHGFSGSIYKCYTKFERTKMNMGEILKKLEDSGLAKRVNYKDINKHLKTKKG